MANNYSSLYQVYVYDRNGTLVADLTGKIRTMQMTVTRNRADAISLNLDLDTLETYSRSIGTSAETILAINQASVIVQRGSNAISGGEIQYVRATADTNNKSLEVRATGWFDLLSKRYTTSYKAYSATDSSAIARDLINTTQGLTYGSFGITLGANPTTQNRARTYEYKNIRDAIVQLSEVINGFDFEVTPDSTKTFNVYYPRQAPHPGVIEFEFQYGRNCASVSLVADGTQMVNQVIVRGQGVGGATQLLATRNDAASQTTYKLRQAIIDRPDVKETTTLNEIGDEELRVRSTPIFIPEVTLLPNTYPIVKQDIWLGDAYTVKVNSDYFSQVAGTNYYVESINISVGEDGVENVSINQGKKVVGPEQDLPPPPPPPPTPPVADDYSSPMGGGVLINVNNPNDPNYIPPPPTGIAAGAPKMNTPLNNPPPASGPKTAI